MPPARRARCRRSMALLSLSASVLGDGSVREMVGLPARLGPYRFDRFGEALGVIRDGRGDRAAEVLGVLEQWLGVLPMLRRRVRGHEDAGRRILDDHHPVLRAQRVVAVKVTRRGGGERKPWLTHRLGGGGTWAPMESIQPWVDPLV